MNEGFTLECISIRQAIWHCTSNCRQQAFFSITWAAWWECRLRVWLQACWTSLPANRTSKLVFLTDFQTTLLPISVWTESESEVARSCPTLATPWTVAYQAPQSMEFSRQEYWSGLPFPSPGDLPNPGIKPGSSTLQGDALPSEPQGKPYMK